MSNYPISNQISDKWHNNYIMRTTFHIKENVRRIEKHITMARYCDGTDKDLIKTEERIREELTDMQGYINLLTNHLTR